MKVSIKQISQMTGFSPATVSNALNFKRGVNADTAAAVRKAAQDLGYFEEGRITKVKFVIFKYDGSIVEDTPYFTQLISGVEEECRACGMEMQICNLNKKDANYKEQARWLFNDKSAAVILLANEVTDEDADLIKEITIPFVVIDYWKEDMCFNSVSGNNVDSARMATEYLISKGHKEIGYLMGDFRIKPFRARSSGYQAALRKANLPLKKEYCIRLSCRMDEAYQDMKTYLMSKPKLPTAFFSDNDMILLGAVKAMQEYGIRIPEDVSVVGYDDLPFSAISSPAITTIHVPKLEMGRVAVKRLNEIIKGDNIKLKIQICTQFIERDSVREIR